LTSIDNLEKRIEKLENRVLKLEKSNQEPPTNNTNISKAKEIEKKIASELKKFQTKELVLIAFRLFIPKDLNEMKNRLKSWGWVEDTFFTKNFSTVLLKTGLVQKDQVKNGKDAFPTLTLKGEIEADKIISKHNLT